MSNDTALIPYTETGMVAPLASPAQAKAAIQAYEALKASIVQPSDIQKIQGRDFLKKAFWRRVATCFGLSLDLVSEHRGHDEKGGLFYSVIYKAIAPNGRTMTADGYCSTSEPGRQQWPEHNVRATAHTRAKNRAISDLVGGGEVSADEMTDYVEADPTPAPRQQAAPRIQEQTVPNVPSWKELRLYGAKLQWSVDDYDRALRDFVGDKPAAEYTNADKAKWELHLKGQLKRKQAADAAVEATRKPRTLGTVVDETTGEILTPDPEQPHDLTELDAGRITA